MFNTWGSVLSQAVDIYRRDLTCRVTTHYAAHFANIGLKVLEHHKYIYMPN